MISFHNTHNPLILYEAKFRSFASQDIFRWFIQWSRISSAHLQKLKHFCDYSSFSKVSIHVGFFIKKRSTLKAFIYIYVSYLNLQQVSQYATWKNKFDFIWNNLLATRNCFSCKLFCYTINKQNIGKENINYTCRIFPLITSPHTCFYCRMK